MYSTYLKIIISVFILSGLTFSETLYANGSCTNIFPSPLNIFDATGNINFRCRAKVTSSINNILITKNIYNPSGSCPFTCPTAYCIKSNTLANTFNPGSFQTENPGSPNFSVGNNQTNTIGSTGIVSFNDVTVNNNATLNFASQGANTVYKIDKLNLKYNSTANLASGDYWINELIVNNNVTINIIGSDTVRIYIKKNVEFQDGSQINVNLSNPNNAKKLFIYAFDNIDLKNDVRAQALIYSQRSINLRNRTILYGAATAKNIALDNDATVIFDETAVNLGQCIPGANEDVTHFVISHDNVGTYCIEEPITVTAKDGTTTIGDFESTIVLKTSTNKGKWRLINGNGTFSDSNITDGQALYTFNTNDNGVAEFGLTYTDGISPVNIGVELQSNSSITDDNTEGNLVFTEGGLLITSTPVTEPIDFTNLPASYNNTQTAGVTDIMHITAFGIKSPGVCGIINLYTGNKAINFWSDYVNPNSGTINYTINGNNIATSEASSSSQIVNFSNGTATVNAKYRDVGVMKVHLKDTIFPNILNLGIYSVQTSTASFVVKPAKFGIVATGNPGAINENGAIFTRAGENFTVTVTSQDFDGNTTPNFGNEETPESVNIYSSTLVAPVGGLNGSLNNGYIDNSNNFTKINPGIFQNTIASFDEVGIIKISAELANQNYIGTGNVITESGNVGRFIPYTFTAISNTPEFTSNTIAGGFTYLGDLFTYKTKPVITVTATSKLGGTTKNYDGDYFKLDTSVINPIYTGNHATSLINATAASIDITVVNNGNGNSSIILGDGGGLSFPKVTGTNLIPFTAELLLSVDVIDLDNVTYNSNPFIFGSTTSGNGIAFEFGSNTFYEGRMTINNTFGTELLSLDLPLEIQYFSANNTWDTNIADNFTVFNDLSKILLTPDNASLVTTPTLGTLINGVINLNLSSPSGGGTGSVNIELDLFNAGLTHLQDDWAFDNNQDGIANDNPRALATFGIYAGRDSIIYMTETY